MEGEGGDLRVGAPQQVGPPEKVVSIEAVPWKKRMGGVRDWAYSGTQVEGPAAATVLYLSKYERGKVKTVILCTNI